MICLVLYFPKNTKVTIHSDYVWTMKVLLKTRALFSKSCSNQMRCDTSLFLYRLVLHNSISQLLVEISLYFFLVTGRVVFHMPDWLHHFLSGARILLKRTLEAYVGHYFQFKLEHIMQEHRLVSLITILRGLCCSSPPFFKFFNTWYLLYTLKIMPKCIMNNRTSSWMSAVTLFLVLCQQYLITLIHFRTSFHFTLNIHSLNKHFPQGLTGSSNEQRKPSTPRLGRSDRTNLSIALFWVHNLSMIFIVSPKIRQEKKNQVKQLFSLILIILRQ